MVRDLTHMYAGYHPRCMSDHCPEGTMDVEEVAEDAGGEDEDD